MKNTIKIFVAAVALLFSLQSCLKEEKDLFVDTPTARMTEYLANAKKVLMKPEKGWLLHYYPHSAQSYGGYSFTIKFGEESATVGTEIAVNLDATIESLYKLGTDSGPMLSFDTNNDFMHFFATPSSGMYQGYGGDFEFMILEVADDHVKLMGRRSGNVMMMYPLTEDGPEYLKKVAKTAEDFLISGMKGTIGGVEVTADFDKSYQQVDFNIGGETTSVAYSYTDQGLRLYEPVSIGDLSIQELNYNAAEMKVSPKGTPDILEGTFPEGFRFYDDYLGTYTMVYNKTDEDDDAFNTVTVTLKEGVKNSTILMSGLNDKYDIEFQYDRGKGVLTWHHQTLGTMDNGYTVRLCAICQAGSFTWSATATFGTTEWNGDTENPEYKLIPGYRFSNGQGSTGFYLCTWTDAGVRSSAPTAASGWRFIVNGSSTTSIRSIYSLIKQK